MRLHPRAGAIISWEPDCSPQVMTAMISSPEPLSEPLDWDQPEAPVTGLFHYACLLSLAPSSLST
jgi:hypothetical protein